ncbi:hypothetical protein [Streptomyces sp. NPDC003077]|uniref:hypothetical protein n=1 Tax=Streptomyces sp. NPDC003077 TaxID=3154443 RepID=UPI0033BCA96F
MRTRPRAARIAAAAALALTTVAGALPAQAASRTVGETREPHEKFAFESFTTSSRTTDYAHRAVDLAGVLVHAGTNEPVADAEVDLFADFVFSTWNPWGDHLPPDWSRRVGLGTVRTDAHGRFALPRAVIDHKGLTSDDLYLFTGTVELSAVYDADDDEQTAPDARSALTLRTKREQTHLTVETDRPRVHVGDSFTITGKVSVPAGFGPPTGTPVLFRFYYENIHTARTTADDDGYFKLKYKVKAGDGGFVAFTAPRDLYLAGDSKPVPTEVPVPEWIDAITATTDRNRQATVTGHMTDCPSPRPRRVALRFAKEGSRAWRTVATVTPTAGGWLKARHQGGNGRYQWKHAETDHCSEAASATAAVHRTETRLPGFHGTPQRPREGRSLVLTGTLQQHLNSGWKTYARRPVEIWYRPAGSRTWARKAVVTTDSRGTYRKTFTAGKDGWWKAVHVGDGTHYSTTSATDWIDVR